MEVFAWIKIGRRIYGMNEITELVHINFVDVFLSIFVILFAARVIVTLFEWVIDKLGIETRKMRQKREEHELLIKTSEELTVLKDKHEESVKESIRHDQMIKDDISNLADTVNGIADTLADMQKRENDTKLKELKDSLIRYYNKYKDIGEWSKIEKDAFWDLFYDYEERGGNGYLHSEVEPVMRSLREVD